MKFNYNGKSKETGIYVISNSIKNRYYIGQTIRNFNKRWNEHKDSLTNSETKSRAANKFLKKDFQKCLQLQPNGNFLEFNIIEIINFTNLTKEQKLDLMNKQEQFWIAEYKKQGKKLYNFTEGGGSFIHPTGTQHTSETKQKISIASKQRWTEPKYREKIIKAHIGLKRTPQAIKNMTKAQNKPEVQQKRIDNMKNRLPMTIFKKGQLPWNVGRYHNKKLISPNGIVYENIISIRAFCKEHNLQDSLIRKVLNFKRAHHKGWKLYIKSKEIT